MSGEKTVRISGYSTELPGDRSVFLGQAENDPSWYITFTNKGVENKIRISDEGTICAPAGRACRAGEDGPQERSNDQGEAVRMERAGQAYAAKHADVQSAASEGRMTALPADVARALQGMRKCGCGRVFCSPLPNKLRCDECVMLPPGAPKTPPKQRPLRPRGLGEY